ncbi:NUDIX domain-containing protein [Labilibaculum sp. A4]|uniref:NUDIX domain-containing protein n=1 Tax=Labilibaculum euxinus TaxID=2686357 RepID=UPI0013654E06|nr:NUDIX domain-containing protein [Labilibaculum euxinus]MDQ1769780.1 NUDIX domain-containing protein [Labilibaculum euxinus]MWN76338.1 NUDIX domain-containing protein [Labilibaculum euxinus]
MYKVFFKDRIIFLGDKSESVNFEGMVYAWVEGESLEGLILQFDEDESKEAIFIVAEDLEQLFEHFESCFKYIEAAGGKVFNSKQQILAIYRLGKWDLPKGKVEKGELVHEAAVREVEEECGITDLKIEKELNSTYHTYWMKGKHMLKRTYWYKMSYSGSESLVPQTEEDIQEAKWLSSDNLGEFKANTYASILEVMNEA